MSGTEQNLQVFLAVEQLPNVFVGVLLGIVDNIALHTGRSSPVVALATPLSVSRQSFPNTVIGWSFKGVSGGGTAGDRRDFFSAPYRACQSRSPRFRVCSPKLRKKSRLFCRLGQHCSEFGLKLKIEPNYNLLCIKLVFAVFFCVYGDC